MGTKKKIEVAQKGDLVGEIVVHYPAPKGLFDKAGNFNFKLSQEIADAWAAGNQKPAAVNKK